MLIERWDVATEVEGTFRVNGSTKRMRELQAAFQSPPDVGLPVIGTAFWADAHVSQYGKKLDWKKENYTTHDVASVFRRFLTQMPVRRVLYLYISSLIVV